MTIHNSPNGERPIAQASGKPLIGASATAGATTVISILTTNREITATTEALRERCASSMKPARQSQLPNITAAASTCTNLMLKMRSNIAI